MGGLVTDSGASFCVELLALLFQKIFFLLDKIGL